MDAYLTEIELHIINENIIVFTNCNLHDIHIHLFGSNYQIQTKWYQILVATSYIPGKIANTSIKFQEYIFFRQMHKRMKEYPKRDRQQIFALSTPFPFVCSFLVYDTKFGLEKKNDIIAKN